MRHAELKVTSGKQTGSTIPLPQGKFLIGREEDCHLRPNSDMVSRHHCVFTVDEFAVRLRDLGSTNGTLVNGERIRGGVMLKPGDLVSIGKIDFQVIIRDDTLDTATHMSFESDTHFTQQPVVQPQDSDEIDTLAPASQTISEIPVASNPALQAPPVGDTQFMTSVPMQPTLGYPPMAYPQMMPYGYPGYPQMYPQQPPMDYPMPGMYPQQPMMPMPGPVQEPAPTAGSSPELPVRLPNPEDTGAKAPAPAGPAGEKTAEAKAKEEAPKKADDIIQQYLKRRPSAAGK